MVMSDPYSGFRDSRGRFVSGNPGRTTYTWLNGEEFKVKYPFLNIVLPDACHECGGVSFRFNVRWDNKRAYTVRCRCNGCNAMRWYKPYRDSWTPI